MKDSTRRVDVALASWGRWVRAGGAVGTGLGYPSMTIIAKMSGVSANRVRPDEDIMQEIDILVGKIDQPYRRVIHRHYVDERKYGGYHSGMRTQAVKAKSEGMTIGGYKVSLHIGRNQLGEKLEIL